MDLADEVVIVTGAFGNLGAAVLRQVLARGARVVAVDRSPPAEGALAGVDPGRLLVLSGVDLGLRAETDRVVADATARFGRVSALVNTVGGFRTGRVLDETAEGWDAMMRLNAGVALVTSAAVLPALVRAGRGSIVHIAASPGLRAAAGQAAYAASKAAVIRLVEAIAAEHRTNRISANCLLPGTLDTPQNRAAMPDARADSFISTDSVAALIGFLISPAGAVVTGGAIPANGLV